MSIVLLHGAGHGAWCWFRFAPLLRAQGFDVVVPDLPGHGRDAARWAEVEFDEQVATMDTDHSPFLSQPAELAEIVANLISR